MKDFFNPENIITKVLSGLALATILYFGKRILSYLKKILIPKKILLFRIKKYPMPKNKSDIFDPEFIVISIWNPMNEIISKNDITATIRFSGKIKFFKVIKFTDGRFEDSINFHEERLQLNLEEIPPKSGILFSMVTSSYFSQYSDLYGEVQNDPLLDWNRIHSIRIFSFINQIKIIFDILMIILFSPWIADILTKQFHFYCAEGSVCIERAIFMVIILVVYFICTRKLVNNTLEKIFDMPTELKKEFDS